MRKCIECGESWIDNGSDKCPYCDSTDTIELQQKHSTTNWPYVNSCFKDQLVSIYKGGKYMCNSCEALMINGRYCHELGCPDSWQGKAIECAWCGGIFVPDVKGQKCCCEECDQDYASQYLI